VGEESPEGDAGEAGVEITLKYLKVVDRGPGPQCWARLHMWGANLHPWELGRQQRALGGVGSTEGRMESDLKLKMAEERPGPPYWAWPHMWWANPHPWPLGKQLGAIGQVGCQQGTKKDPYQVSEGAV